jgi:hypothetical protein
MDNARHVIGCHLTHHTGFRNAIDDVSTTFGGVASTSDVVASTSDDVVSTIGDSAIILI